MKLRSGKQANLSEASRWYMRRQLDDVGADDREGFHDWLQQSPDNRLDYRICEIAVESAAELRDDPDLKFLFGDGVPSSAAGSTPAHGRGRWTRYAASMLAASLAAVACVAVYLANQPEVVRYRTAVGEQRTIISADDSVITLNTDTDLSVEFDGSARRIRLQRGQAFFSVTPDPARPFEVYAHDGIVRAVGTSFDVAINGGEEVTVTVLEGTVEVMPGAAGGIETPAAGPSPKVTHGEKVKYWQNGTIAQVIKADDVSVRAWREGKMDFDNQRLDDAIAEHNRYTSTKIIVGDDELKNLRISGVFRIGDTESLLFLLKESLGVLTVKKANVIVLLPNRKLREAEQPELPGEPARG